MFFSNLTSYEEGTFTRNNGKSFPLVLEDVSGTDSSVRLINDTLYVTKRNEGMNIFEVIGDPNDSPIPKPIPIKEVEHRFNFSGNQSQRKRPKPKPVEVNLLTYAEVADTEDNPMIVVMTKGIKFFNDIPTLINTLFVDESIMLVELVSGACEFQMADGSFVALQRCNDFDLSGRNTSNPFDCKTLKKNTLCQTKGGWDKSYELVCPLYVKSTNRTDKNGFHIRCDISKAVYLNLKGIKAQEEKEERMLQERLLAEEKAKKEKEEKLIRDREMAAAARAEESRRKSEELEMEMKIKAAERKLKKDQKKFITLDSGSSTRRSAGAEAFLSMLDMKE